MGWGGGGGVNRADCYNGYFKSTHKKLKVIISISDHRTPVILSETATFGQQTSAIFLILLFCDQQTRRNSLVYN